MQGTPRLVVLGFALLAAGVAAADDAPPPQGWSGKGELGFVDARGNTDAETIDAKLGLSDQIGPWKHSLNVDVLDAKTNNVTSANRKDATWQSNFDLSKQSYVYGSLSYIDDQFSGFAYQANATVGYGRKFVDTASTKLSVQLGAGYGQLQPETPVKNTLGAVIGEDKAPKENAAVVQGEAKFEHALSATTKILEDLKVTYADVNTYLQNDLALQVKINNKLALSVAYEVRHNTNPPEGTKATDTLSTVNLVYSF
jgi:putative salt-induced outer membrane protein